MATSRIHVFDTTLRDGEQSPGASMTTDEKLRMARQLERLGVDVIEAGFPVSSPDDFTAVRRVAEAVREPTIAALCRATERDIEQGVRALEPANRPRLHVFLATSRIHLEHKLQMTPAACLDRIGHAVRLARSYVDDVEFSAEDATRTEVGFLCRAIQTAIEAGAATINIPDTVGYTYPSEYRHIMEALFAAVVGIEGVTVSVHCHNDLGLAVANSLAAIEAGARQVECTVNGIGERAGNAALEELVMALRVRGDVLPFTTGIRTAELYPASRLLASITGIDPQPNKAVVGRNAFAHEAGIHQAGVLRHYSTYEIMRPEWVGVPRSELVLGKHSGRHAVAKRCEELGHPIADDDLERVYRYVIDVADKKKRVYDEDLLAILRSRDLDADDERFVLVDVRVVCGMRSVEAVVSLRDGPFPAREAKAEADAPLTAAFQALERLLGLDVHIDDIAIRAPAPGTGPSSEVQLRARVRGHTLRGEARGPDFVVAAVRAYLHAVNKAVRLGVAESRSFEYAHDFWAV